MLKDVSRRGRNASVHLSYFLISATLGLFILRGTLASVIVAPELSSYIALFDLDSRSLPQKLPILPVAVVGYLLGLSVTQIFVSYYSVYLVLGGYLFANFARAYTKTILADYDESALSAYLFPTVGAVVFITFPYMLVGDNFPQAFALRVWLPGYLWAGALFLQEKSRLRFLLWTGLLSIGAIIDIRFLLSGGIVGLGLLIIPAFVADRERISLLGFVIHGLVAVVVAAPILLHDAGAFLGLGVESATTVGVPFTRQAFESTYTRATWINAVRGLDFFPTYESWNATYHRLGMSPLLESLSLLLPVLAVGIPSLLALSAGRRQRVFILSVLTFWTLAIVLFTRGLFGFVPVIELAFLAHGWRPTPFLERFLLLFRTPRLLSLLTQTVYSSMLPLALSMLAVRLKPANFAQTRTPVVRTLRSFIAPALVALVLSGIFSFSAPAFVEGDWYRPSPELHRHETLSGTLVERVSSTLRTTSFDLNGMNWVFPDHRASEAHSTFHFYLDYLFGPSGLAHRRPTDVPAMLEPWGYRYFVVDRANGGLDSAENHLRQSFGDPGVEVSGFAVYPTKQKVPHYRAGSPVLVFGGLEGYRQFLSLSERLDWGAPPIPLFADGPPPPSSLRPSQVLIPSYMSRVSILAWAALNEEGAKTIPLAQFARISNPAEAWAPGYVTDTHQGLWNPFAGSQPGYAWQYSHVPQAGFVSTSATGAQLEVPLGLRAGSAVRLFARVLTGPNQGTVEVHIEGQVLTVDARVQRNRSVLQWFDLGLIRGSKDGGQASIINRDGDNALNLLLLVPDEIYERAADDFRQSNRLLSYLVTPADIDRGSGYVEFEIDLSREDRFSLTVPLPSIWTEDPRLWVDDNEVNSTWKRVGNSSQIELGMLSAGLHRLRLNGSALNNTYPEMALLQSWPAACCDSDSVVELSPPDQPLHLQGSTEFVMPFASNGPFSLVVPRVYQNAWTASVDGCNVVTHVFAAYYVFVGIAIVPQAPGICTGHLRTIDMRNSLLFLLSSIALIGALSLLVAVAAFVFTRRVWRFITARL